MAELMADCPRCGIKHSTFDAKCLELISERYDGWKNAYEAFSVCRKCYRATIFLLLQRSSGANLDALNASYKGYLNPMLEVECFISLQDNSIDPPPAALPADIEKIFWEGSVCCSSRCWNAAATMFRLCLDLATKSLLPADPAPGLKRRQRRDLGPRLQWLFENSRLALDLQELSACVHQDGNDGAHAGSIEEIDALDIRDFARALLERLYTEPAKLAAAKQRRTDRRSPKDAA